jgi:hypothetical protein
MRRVAFLASLVLVAGCGGSSGGRTTTRDATAPRGEVVLAADCGKPEPRPATIVLACADAGMTLDGLQWKGWGKAVATATGAINVKGCDPGCADDNRTYTYAVTVEAHQVVTCPGSRRQYAFIRYRVTDDRFDKNRPDDEDRGYDCR